MIFGLILIIIGVLWLLTKMGILAGSLWGYFWPIFLIVLGFSMILGWRSGQRFWAARLAAGRLI